MIELSSIGMRTNPSLTSHSNSSGPPTSLTLTSNRPSSSGSSSRTSSIHRAAAESPCPPNPYTTPRNHTPVAYPPSPTQTRATTSLVALHTHPTLKPAITPPVALLHTSYTTPCNHTPTSLSRRACTSILTLCLLPRGLNPHRTPSIQPISTFLKPHKAPTCPIHYLRNPRIASRSFSSLLNLHRLSHRPLCHDSQDAHHACQRGLYVPRSPCSYHAVSTLLHLFRDGLMGLRSLPLLM